MDRQPELVDRININKSETAGKSYLIDKGAYYTHMKQFIAFNVSSNLTSCSYLGDSLPCGIFYKLSGDGDSLNPINAFSVHMFNHASSYYVYFTSVIHNDQTI